ncbi:tetratricopeptide repeat protein [Arthrobacter sp. NicSoilB8]|uniref:tetratricopeptide repeat protein n=1 Tax=Arthrobacter sp. NicSoilB8 TaxID=2830998 RepID=UPI001CC7233D|nr:tetratricopeptide repeat protein [Arthrobacter sp. NicSoilB8]
MGRTWAGFGKKRTPHDVWSDWKAADEAGDAGLAAVLASELLELTPESYYSWFQAGLLSKALGNWPESLNRNTRALKLFTPKDAEEFNGANPAAWNLGIASTALGDWATARHAWVAYGLDQFRADSGPIDVDCGMAPVRLNPDRPSLPHQVLFGAGNTEVVWCWRRSPAHAVIASVPMPESGHRFRDTVLHDGEPKGTRRLDGQEVSVFDELGRLKESGLPTWQAQIVGATGDDVQALAALLGQRGLGLDDWSGIRLMCSKCSHGAPQDGHDHMPTTSDDAQRLGLAGHESDLVDVIKTWLAGRRGIDVHNLDLLW